MKENRKNTAIFIAYEDEQPIDIANAEKGLLKAMLAHAIADLKRPGKIGRLARAFFLDDDEEYLFSFRSICDHLDIDTQTVLKEIGLVEVIPDKRKKKDQSGRGDTKS